MGGSASRVRRARGNAGIGRIYERRPAPASRARTARTRPADASLSPSAEGYHGKAPASIPGAPMAKQPEGMPVQRFLRLTFPGIGLCLLAAAVPSAAREPQEIAALLRDPSRILL